MTKFAFNEIEFSAFIAAAKNTLPRLPRRIEDLFTAFIASNTTIMKTAAGKNESSVLRQQQLQDLLQRFLQENGLSQHKEIQEYLQGVVKTMGAYLQQYGPSKNPTDEWFDKARSMYPAKPEYDVPSAEDRPQPTVPGGRQPVRQNPVFTRADEAFWGKDPSALLQEPEGPGPQVKKVAPPTKPVYQKKPMGASVWSLQRKVAMQNHDDFLASLLKLADSADEAGMLEQADKVAAVLPLCKTLKIAQYEGVQNYWIANGRAFEKAWKEKRSKGTEKMEEGDFRSAHDCWFEVLEEYQKGLLTNHEDFLSKYAARGNDDVSAIKMLMARISDKVGGGTSPGVALYESIDEMIDGKHAETVFAAVTEAVKEVKKQAEASGNEKIVAQADDVIKTAEGFFSNLWKGVRNVADFFTPARVPTTVDLAKAILKNKETVINALEHIRDRGLEQSGRPSAPAAKPAPSVPMGAEPGLTPPNVPTLAGEPAGSELLSRSSSEDWVRTSQTKYPRDQRILSQDLYAILSPVYQNLQEYLARQRLLGMDAPTIPTIDSAFAGGVADLEKLADLGQAMMVGLEHVNLALAKQMDGYLKAQYPKGLPKPATMLLAEKEQEKQKAQTTEEKPDSEAPAPIAAPAAPSPAATRQDVASTWNQAESILVRLLKDEKTLVPTFMALRSLLRQFNGNQKVIDAVKAAQNEERKAREQAEGAAAGAATPAAGAPTQAAPAS